MKLYRGLKSKNFSLPTLKVSSKMNEYWQQILSKREQCDFTYPHTLDNLVKELENFNKTTYQHFTDQKQIAYRYAREKNGLLVEIDVPVNDIINYFSIEFQNYTKRKKEFQIVYCIDSKILNRKKKEWMLKIGEV